MQTRFVQFVWHMHQPYYGLPNRSTFFLPWVRLHSVKSYYDMARMLEAHPSLRGTINFSGSLLKQLHEYVDGKRDTWWDLTLKAPEALTEADKRHLLKHFFSINWDHCIRRYPRYAELLDKRNAGRGVETFETRDWGDLQVWFNLAWCGFSVRDESEVVRGLIARGADFNHDDKVAILSVHTKVIESLPELYRRLVDSGQVEVSVTPMYHPILPLIIDTDAASRATPQRPRPARFQAIEDAHHHVRAALQTAERFFGFRPQGMWPAEGSISPEAVRVFDAEGVRWIASDEDVLRLSRGGSWERSDISSGWHLDDLKPAIFFRDHAISDQIGFSYAKNDPAHAAADFLARVRAVPLRAPSGVISVILDGENPWEHYPNDGKAFLEALYQALESAPDIKTTTPSQVLRDHTPERLHYLHSGSWILANYQIWIGHPEENRGWDLLKRTREDLLRRIPGSTVSPENINLAWEALYAAEGSDWFWWYGDDFNTENDADFDRLFRENLKCVYFFLGVEAPADLDLPLIGSTEHTSIFHLPRGLISPTIDGRSEYFYEWTDAGVYVNTGARGSMFENTRMVERILFGFDHEHLYVRVEPSLDISSGFVGHELRISLLVDGKNSTVSCGHGIATFRAADGGTTVLRSAYKRAFEVAIPLALAGAGGGEDLSLQVAVWRNGIEVERHPSDGRLNLQTPDPDFEGRNWMV